MKIGTRIEYTREEVCEILLAHAYAAASPSQHRGRDHRDSRIRFFGQNRYRPGEKNQEQRCRDCGCTVLARTVREPFDQAIVVLSEPEKGESK